MENYRIKIDLSVSPDTAEAIDRVQQHLDIVNIILAVRTIRGEALIDKLSEAHFVSIGTPDCEVATCPHNVILVLMSQTLLYFTVCVNDRYRTVGLVHAKCMAPLFPWVFFIAG